MGDVIVAWAAGIVDGEGCISIYPQDKTHILTLAITMTHEATIRRFHEFFKVGTVCYVKSKAAKWKDKWQFAVTGKKAYLLIKQLYPYIFTKKDQADLAIEYGEKCLDENRIRGMGSTLSDEAQVMRVVLYDEMKALNKRGLTT